MDTISARPIQDLLQHTLDFTRHCLDRGDLPAALRALGRAASLAPHDAEILSQRGLLALVLKDHETARLDFLHALQLDPRNVAAHVGLARVHWERSTPAEAEISAQAALALDPINIDARALIDAIAASRVKGAASRPPLDRGTATAAKRPAVELMPEATRQARQQVWNFLTVGSQYFADAKPPLLSPLHLQNSRVLPRRKDILARMPKGGICAEIGTQTGNFAKQILAVMRPAKLHIYDIDFTPFDHAYFQKPIQQGVVELHKGDSSSLLGAAPDASFDFIYIDGDHAYDGAVRDLEQAARKVKDDGWIVCNDYTIYSPLEKSKYGVYRAVNEFCLKHDFEIAYLGLHQWSYHDVALRKMKPADRIAAAANHRPTYRRARLAVPVPGIETSATVPPAADTTLDAASIIQTIGAGDEMFTGDKVHYFGVGKSALHCIESAITAAGKSRNSVHRILDLPCGHGRVMRCLKAAFPEAQITACDLNKGAVDFCAQTFAARPVYSNVDVSRIPLTEKYDLIWSGSLLTHLRAGACADFIRLWNGLVNPGGLIVFTLHGRWVERSLATGRYLYGLKDADVRSLLQEYYQTGFGYADYPGASGYGISLSSPAYVLSQLVALPDLKLISFHEKGWDNHQDVVCLQKLTAAEPMG